MVFLNICENQDVLKVFQLVKTIILILKIAAPIILIVAAMLDYARAIKDNDELAKTSKLIANKLIAAILIFLIPTFVNAIANNIGFNKSNYSSCIANATDEYIDAAYVAQAQAAVDKAKKTETRGDYNSALIVVQRLKNDKERERLLKELEAVLKKIEEREEQERLERERRNVRRWGNNDNGFWFPVGGSTVEEAGGKQFAPGTPTATTLTAHFGGNDSVHQGLGGGHGAIDIGAGKGTYVIASKSGTVTYPGKGDRIDYPDSFIKPDANGKYNCSGLVANRVYIDHGDGTKTGYAHFSANTITVRAGDQVIQGQIIGKVGSSGCSTGYHLHFEVYKNGKKVDPEKYVSGKNPRP